MNHRVKKKLQQAVYEILLEPEWSLQFMKSSNDVHWMQLHPFPYQDACQPKLLLLSWD